MSSGGGFSITSADDGTDVPADGFTPGGNFLLTVLGGTTIAAEILIKKRDGTFHKIPDDDGYSDITGDYARPILATTDDVFKIAVDTATGTWEVAIKPIKL